jgi:hypothetical protein
MTVLPLKSELLTVIMVCLLIQSSFIHTSEGDVILQEDDIYWYSESKTSNDSDGDGIQNGYDSCPNGIENWTSNNSMIDNDEDGCKDHGVMTEWILDTNERSETGYGDQRPRKVASTQDGGFVIIGYYTENFSIGHLNFVYPDIGEWDSGTAIYIVKYDQNNNPDWGTSAYSNSTYSTGSVWVKEVGINPINNHIVIAGKFQFQFNIQGTSVYGHDGATIFILSLDENGVLQQLISSTSNGYSEFSLKGFDISNSGDMVITGQCRIQVGDTQPFFANEELQCAETNSQERNYFIIYINSSFGVEWATYFQGQGYGSESQTLLPVFHDQYGIFIFGALYAEWGIMEFTNSSGSLYLSTYLSYENRSGSCNFMPFISIIDLFGNWTFVDLIEIGEMSCLYPKDITIQDGGDVLISGINEQSEWFGDFRGGYLTFNPFPEQRYEKHLVASFSSINLSWDWISSTGGGIHGLGIEHQKIFTGAEGRVYLVSSILHNTSFGPDYLVPEPHSNMIMMTYPLTISSFIAGLSSDGNWIFGSKLNSVSAKISDVSSHSNQSAIVTGWGQSEYEIVSLLGEDDNDDNDDFIDINDQCSNGFVNWTSTSTTDYDSDGCHDSIEDIDDDNDGIIDTNDRCPRGSLDFPMDDYDIDGCNDSIDDDDDDDSIVDDFDFCPYGLLNWISNQGTDNDGDGCNDSIEDSNDDNDDFQDEFDFCPQGLISWSSTISNDNDMDGCQDATEDNDDDNDGYPDFNDNCPKGIVNWFGNDHDSDGCRDMDEDMDDDGDSISDLTDTCKLGDVGWISNLVNDHDSDGCLDATEDNDDDNDGYPDFNDNCPKGIVNWFGNDHDSDGCRDVDEDMDDDGDSISDLTDTCKLGDMGWISNLVNDHDSDGCLDATEDNDDDNDGVVDVEDALPFDATEASDWDGDGLGDNEDKDDDNDGYSDIHESAMCVWFSDPFDYASIPNDMDGDKICDIIDDDRDGDGYSNHIDQFPDLYLEWFDHDQDGVGDNQDNDDDNDQWPDMLDWFPLDSSEWSDYDGDGIGDNTDNNDDNDPLNDSLDWDPLNPYEWLDSDNDGIGDNEDKDDDNDGVIDSSDIFPFDQNEWSDLDSDGKGDNSDNDIDGDGISNIIEKFTFTDSRNPDSRITKDSFFSLLQSSILFISLVSILILTYKRRNQVSEILRDGAQYFEKYTPNPDMIGIKKDKVEWLVFNDLIWTRNVSKFSESREWKFENNILVPDRRMIGVIDMNGKEYLLKYGILWIRSDSGTWALNLPNYRP